jgi:hypothetical protein
MEEQRVSSRELAEFRGYSQSVPPERELSEVSTPTLAFGTGITLR